MQNENLYWVLSPDVYAALREDLKRQAERERRETLDKLDIRALMPRAPGFRWSGIELWARFTAQKA